MIYTHIMLMGLIDKGLLTVDPEVLSEAVVVTTTTVDEAVKVRTSEVGVPVPSLTELADLDNLDPEVWKTPHQDLAALRGDAD